MKRIELMKILVVNGAHILREGRRHTIFVKGNLKTGVPRHKEIVDLLVQKILKDLEIELKEKK